MDPPDGGKHYQNDEQQVLRSNFDQFNETISQSLKELSILMDSMEKAEKASEEIKSQTDKRIDFLEREITRLSHLEKKSSGNDPQKVCVLIILCIFDF
jgi:gas vesicle protein